MDLHGIPVHQNSHHLASNCIRGNVQWYLDNLAIRVLWIVRTAFSFLFQITPTLSILILGKFNTLCFPILCKSSNPLVANVYTKYLNMVLIVVLLWLYQLFSVDDDRFTHIRHVALLATWWRHQAETPFLFVRGIHRSSVNYFTKTSDAELWCFLWSAPE